MKILIVEDNYINAKLLAMSLESLPFDSLIEIARDADEALEITVEKSFDLILMDINLGNGQMDGTEVMKLLRKREHYTSLPIYAVTCYALPGDRERFINSGFNRYFSKPVDLPALMEAIASDR